MKTKIQDCHSQKVTIHKQTMKTYFEPKDIYRENVTLETAEWSNNKMEETKEKLLREDV